MYERLCCERTDAPATQSPSPATHTFSRAGSTSATSAVVPGMHRATAAAFGPPSRMSAWISASDIASMLSGPPGKRSVSARVSASSNCVMVDARKAEISSGAGDAEGEEASADSSAARMSGGSAETVWSAVSCPPWPAYAKY